MVKPRVRTHRSVPSPQAMAKPGFRRSGMLHLAAHNNTGYRDSRGPTLHPGEVEGEFPQTDPLRFADQIRVRVQNDRGIFERYPFEDRQQNGSPGKQIDGHKRAFEV